MLNTNNCACSSVVEFALLVRYGLLVNSFARASGGVEAADGELELFCDSDKRLPIGDTKRSGDFLLSGGGGGERSGEPTIGQDNKLLGREFFR